MMKSLRNVAFAAFAALAMASVSTPSYAKVDELGVRAEKMDPSDQVLKKEVVATQAPTDGAQSVSVNVTTSYLHKRWFWQNDQAYQVKTPGTAEFVGRLNDWRFKDSDGSLFRFSKGSNVGISTDRPSVDIGKQNVMMSQNDRGDVIGVSAGSVSADGQSRGVNITYRYSHPETYNDVTYTIDSSSTATFVTEQSAHMVWVGSRLYRINAAGQVENLREKPTANVGVRNGLISNSDRMVSYDPTVTAGSSSYNGRNRTFFVNRDYVHEENFQRLRYTIQELTNATFVPEQNAYMAWVDNKLYRVRVGSDDVVQLNSRPVVNGGSRSYKLDYSDPLSSVNVEPLSLSSDSHSVLVSVRKYWRHTENFQVVEYYTQDTQIATYNESYKMWTILVDGRIYVIAFDGDVVNDSSVVVVKAPGSLHRPEVVVVKPNGEDPPVVVPTKKRPPVVNTDDDPPVVVPGKRKAPAVVTGDDDGPAVVVPRR